MLVKLRNMFFAGIAVIFPVLITFLVIRFLVIELNRWVLSPLVKFLNPYLGAPYAVTTAKAGIFVLMVLVICLIGWAANIIVIKKFFAIWEKMFLKVPMFGRIYNAVKQISTAFLGEGKTVFKKVVLLEYPRKGIYSLGFVTAQGTGEINSVTKRSITNVFVPTTPNPTSGMFLAVPENELHVLDMTVEEGMKLVISGGAVIPPYCK